MRIGRVVAPLFFFGLIATPGGGQEPGAETTQTLNLFYDCQGPGCRDLDFFRREIPYVNWVRDREDADVHVLVTSRTTGGGGREYQLAYFGLRVFEGEDQQLVVSTSGDATTDEVRTALAARLAVGLVRYVAATSAVDRIRVTPVGVPATGGPVGGPGAATQQDDAWDFWVFRVGLNGNAFGESLQRFSNVSASGSANRTTEDWKFNLGGRYSRNTNTFELPDTTIETVREDWRTDLLLVKSLTAHWSLGARAEAGKSTFLNENLRLSLAPGIEYNVFPYSESSRRALTFQALLTARRWDYAQETIFGQTEETRFAASLTGALDFVQPWGRSSLSLTESYYLHDTSKSRLSIFGSIQVRLFRGFSVNMSGSYARIRDQLHIERGDISDEDILLRQRQLATNYSYFTSFGISYRFGSIFNNVVNPRFGESRGFFVFF